MTGFLSLFGAVLQLLIKLFKLLLSLLDVCDVSDQNKESLHTPIHDIRNVLGPGVTGRAIRLGQDPLEMLLLAV